MNALSLLSFLLIVCLSLALPLDTEHVREKRQMGMFGSPYGGFSSFGGNPYGQMMMPMGYGTSMYSPMSMGTLGYGGGSNFMGMGFRARNRH